jgi:hypothetical protein
VSAPNLSLVFMGFRIAVRVSGSKPRTSPENEPSAPRSTEHIETLISLAEKVSELASRKSPALSIVRAGSASQVPEIIGGKGGTRTLDPGIMSPVLGKSSL